MKRVVVVFVTAVCAFLTSAFSIRFQVVCQKLYLYSSMYFQGLHASLRQRAPVQIKFDKVPIMKRRFIYFSFSPSWQREQRILVMLR